MTNWMIWFENEGPTVGLYHQEETLKYIGEMGLDDVINHTGEEPVMGVFSTEQVSFVQVALPKTSEKKIRLALPSLAEEMIASNPEDNFYVLPDAYQAGQPSEVAVISLKTLEKLIAQVQAAGLSLQALIPDCFLLKSPTEGVNKLIRGDRIIVRSGPHQGFAIQKQHAVLIMQELDSVPVSEPSLSEPSPFNFLQGQFTVKPPKKSLNKKQLLYFAVGGVAVAHLISLAVLGSILTQRLDLLKAKSLELYTQVFPGAIKVSAAKSLIERELQKASARSEDPLTSLLARASQSLAKIPGAKLEKMEYNQKGLTLHLILPNMEALEQLSQFKQERVTEQGDGVWVDLLITPGDA